MRMVWTSVMIHSTISNGLSNYYWLVYYRMHRNNCHTCPNQLWSTSYRTVFHHQSDFKMSIYQTIISSILASYFKFQNRSKSKTMKIYPNIRQQIRNRFYPFGTIFQAIEVQTSKFQIFFGLRRISMHCIPKQYLQWIYIRFSGCERNSRAIS